MIEILPSRLPYNYRNPAAQHVPTPVLARLLDPLVIQPGSFSTLPKTKRAYKTKRNRSYNSGMEEPQAKPAPAPKRRLDLAAKPKSAAAPKPAVEKAPRAKREEAPKRKLAKSPKATSEKVPRLKPEQAPKPKGVKAAKRKIEFIVERTRTGYSAYAKHHSIYTTGGTSAELKAMMVEATNLYHEEKGVGVLYTLDNLIITPDLPQFFEYYGISNSTVIADRISMSASLVAEIVSGSRKATPQQSAMILKGLRDHGRELASIDLL
jgi:ribosomal protein S8E